MSNDHDGPDAAEQAFNDLRDDLAALRAVVDQVATRQMEAPNYSETLGGIVQAIDGILDRVNKLEEASENGTTPQGIVDQIVESGADARDADQKMINATGLELKAAIDDVR